MGDAPDLIDYTALEKRGIIKKKEVRKLAAPISRDGFVDFSAIGQDKINEIANSNQTLPLTNTGQVSSDSSNISSQSATSSFGSFWDQLPGQAVSQTQSAETSYYSNQASSLSPSSNDYVNELKLKLEDMEYKLARLTEKLDIITEKLTRFQNKIE